MGKRVLVVVTSNVRADQVAPAIAGRVDDDAEVHVVAPASGLSKLQWLTNAEDDARADAGGRAAGAADAIPAETVDAEAGDTDPLLAIEDALRTFPAEEILVVTRPDDELSWLEAGAARSARERFDLPITHLVVD